MIFNWSLYLFEIWSTPAALFIPKKMRNTIPQLGGGGVKIQFRKVSHFIHVMTSFLAMTSGLLASLYSKYSPKLLVVPVLFLGFLLVAHPKQLQSVGTPGAHPCCWSSQIFCHFNISKNWSHFYFGRMIHTSYGKTSNIFNSPIWHRPLSFLILLKKISKTIRTPVISTECPIEHVLDWSTTADCRPRACSRSASTDISISASVLQSDKFLIDTLVQLFITLAPNNYQ